MKHPVRGAYTFAEMSQPCGNCAAEPYALCHHPDGTDRRVPCIARLKQLPDPGCDDTDLPVTPEGEFA